MMPDRPIRIALVIERMDPARGGRERSTAQIAAKLAERGHRVTILCQEAKVEAIGAAKVRPLGRRGGGRAGRLGRFVEDVQRDMGAGGYDIVHATLPIPGANVYQPRGGTVPAQRQASIRRRRSLVGKAASGVADAFNFHRHAMGELERQVAADPRTTCLAVSEMVREEFRRYYERVEGVHVVYNAVDIPDVDDAQRAQWRQQFRREIGADDNTVVYLTAATNFRLKGVFEAFKAFAIMQGRGLFPDIVGMLEHESVRDRRRAMDARLVVLGDGDTEEVGRQAGMRSLDDKVHALGHVEDVFRWYAAADVVVLLSWYDPCSRVILEAVRWCIPSVTTAFNGASEILGDGAGAVVPSPRHIGEAAEAMAKLGEPLRRDFAAKRCAEIAPTLSTDRHVDELLAAYAHIISR